MLIKLIYKWIPVYYEWIVIASFNLNYPKILVRVKFLNKLILRNYSITDSKTIFCNNTGVGVGWICPVQRKAAFYPHLLWFASIIVWSFCRVYKSIGLIQIISTLEPNSFSCQVDFHQEQESKWSECLIKLQRNKTISWKLNQWESRNSLTLNDGHFDQKCRRWPTINQQDKWNYQNFIELHFPRAICTSTELEKMHFLKLFDTSKTSNLLSMEKVHKELT